VEAKAEAKLFSSRQFGFMVLISVISYCLPNLETVYPIQVLVDPAWITALTLAAARASELAAIGR